MGMGGEFMDYYDMEADADPQPAEAVKAQEDLFIASEPRGMVADAYTEIARRLKELQAERGE